MNPVVVAALLQYGPTAFTVLQKLLEDFEKGRTQTTVTSADVAELSRLSKLTAAEIFARAGVQLPPT